MEVEACHLQGEFGLDSLSGFLGSPPRTHGEASSPLAIHVYSTLAKLHKHSLIPYLPRIMSSVLSSLSSSSQLHPACMQVVSALAVHTIDSSRDPASNEDTLRSLCDPLLSALLSPHPPHLSPGAASCLQSLVESNRWRCAPLDLQELVCAKGMHGLIDECMQTVAHMELMGSLAKVSSGVVIHGYGAPLLAAGMDILKSSSSTTKRVAAAQLLESVLKIADAELLDLDISPIVGVLKECQQDKVAGVRTAVADALRTASSYTSFDNPCSRKPVMQQGICGLRHEVHVNSPAMVKQETGLPIGGTPRHGTLFASTPSSNKSDTWLRRLPLATLQPSSMANTAFVSATRKRPVASRLSEYKENLAPTHSKGVPAAMVVHHRKPWMPKNASPLLWSHGGTRKNHAENWNLFDSPQTPIVPFREESESGKRDSSVTTLLEKHFGKQPYLFEDEINLSNLASFSKREISDPEEQCDDGEVCNSLDQGSSGSSPPDSSGTDLCCGTEGICSPDKERASDGESSIASEHGSNLPNQAWMEDLMTTPRTLVRTLQFDDEYETSIDLKKHKPFDAGTPDDERCSIGALSQSKEGGRYDNSRTSTESMPGSESYAFSEGDSQVNMNSIDSSSMVKRRARHSVSSKMRTRTSDLMYAGMCLEEDTANQHGDQALGRHSSTYDVYEQTNHGESLVSDMDLNIAAMSQRRTQRYTCLRLRGKGHFVVLFAISIGLFVAGFTTYLASLEASNVLVPT